jgi:hypothetical protein
MGLAQTIAWLHFGKQLLNIGALGIKNLIECSGRNKHEEEEEAEEEEEEEEEEENEEEENEEEEEEEEEEEDRSLSPRNRPLSRTEPPLSFGAARSRAAAGSASRQARSVACFSKRYAYCDLHFTKKERKAKRSGTGEREHLLSCTVFSFPFMGRQAGSGQGHNNNKHWRGLPGQEAGKVAWD